MIQLRHGPNKGRVITGLWGTVPTKDGGRSWEILAAYSDDLGETWKRSTPPWTTQKRGSPTNARWPKPATVISCSSPAIKAV